MLSKWVGEAAALVHAAGGVLGVRVSCTPPLTLFFGTLLLVSLGAILFVVIK